MRFRNSQSSRKTIKHNFTCACIRCSPKINSCGSRKIIMCNFYCLCIRYSSKNKQSWLYKKHSMLLEVWRCQAARKKMVVIAGKGIQQCIKLNKCCRKSIVNNHIINVLDSLEINSFGPRKSIVCN